MKVEERGTFNDFVDASTEVISHSGDVRVRDGQINRGTVAEGGRDRFPGGSTSFLLLHLSRSGILLDMLTPEDMDKLRAVWETEAYTARVLELEAQGLTTSDAQAAADVEAVKGELKPTGH